MKLSYVIDNQTYTLVDILKGLLTEHKGRSLDVATAYFTVGGFGLVKEGLMDLGNFRLLLGAEPSKGVLRQTCVIAICELKGSGVLCSL